MPPKKKEDPTKKLLVMMQERNRPYSITNLVDEMHGDYSKTVIQKSIDTLVENGKIVCQLFGKSTKLYYPKQEGLAVATNEELKEMDEKIEEHRTQVEEMKEKLEGLRTQKNILAAKQTLPELRQTRTEIETDTKKAGKRLQELINGSSGINPDSIKTIEKEFKKNCQEWKRRRALTRELLSFLEEPTGKPAKVFVEELGLETDEMAGVSLVIKGKDYIVNP